MEKDIPDATIAEAKTLSELNIHLGYISKRITDNNVERSKDMGEIKQSLDKVVLNQITRVEFDNVKEKTKENGENIIILMAFKNTLIGKMWGIGIMAGLIVGFLNLIISSALN
jgi:tetrahydromethanopterin S-methyltransferase subunit G